MEKINAVLVLLRRDTLEETLKKLKLDNINLVTIVADSDTGEKTFRVGDNEVPRTAFSAFPKVAKKLKDFVWLIGSCVNGVDDLDRMKNFLMTVDVPEDNIVNLEVTAQMSGTWSANLRCVEKNGADFFATGNEFMRDGLNMKYIPCVHVDKKISRGGVNLADANQDLRQSFLTAKHVFEHVKPGMIKFVLIGLTPDSFYYDNAKDFSHQKNLQYVFALNLVEENSHDRLLKTLLSDDVKNFFSTTAAPPDPNFDALKTELNREFSAKAIADWNDDKKNLTPATVETNVQILKDYIELCLANGAKPVGVVFPVAPAVRKTYNAELLKNFRAIIHQLEENSDFMCIDWFDHFNYDCFQDMTHLASRGSWLANAVVALKLNINNLIPDESFCDMTYEYFNGLSKVAPKDEYNALLERVFKASAKMLRRKNKIKVGFVLIDSAQWCGDDLYNSFAQEERFETTILDCLRLDRAKNEIIRTDFWRGVEQFKARGNLNVVALDKQDSPVPPQDVLIFLTPYFDMIPVALRPQNLTIKTLITHIIYSLAVSVRSDFFYNRIMFRTAWKIFFPSVINLKLYGKRNTLGMPRGFYSGYPKLDAFYKNPDELHFAWKMIRPNAKKIIWAPHHSINSVTRWSTFQWNYKFMYDFAKAHPETSWVVKPHQALFVSAVKDKVFSSLEDFKAYLQKWNDLPNAKVYTGAYYQAIFATSDGLIHDCGSFTAEYQYVDKPMIYLTREGTVFNELGNEIFKVSYLIDGKDFDAIAATLQRVIIDGDDYKASERKKIFDKYLNYPKANGMLASKFIFKSIADEVKA